MLRRLLLAVILMAIPVSAAAQVMCLPRGAMTEHHRKAFKETRSAIGLVSNGSVLEVLTAENGNWSIIITNPRGVACRVASGTAWEHLPNVSMGPPA